MYSQFFVLSLRGDTLIFKDYRGDAVRNAAEIFYGVISKLKEESNPIFHVDGVQYIYMKNNGMYFVFTTKRNVSPVMSIELLERIAQLVKDYCGVVTEETIRKNFVLIYELLDEIMDHGYPQGTSTEKVRAFVLNTPEYKQPKQPKHGAMGGKTTPGATANKPITEEGANNEIYIDLLENMTVLFGANGNLVNSELEGVVKIRSFLKGNPELRLGLNEDISLSSAARDLNYRTSGGIWLENCAFNEIVNTSAWDADRALIFKPPEGEFILLQYRVDTQLTSFVPPFRVLPYLEVSDSTHAEFYVKIRADIPKVNFGNNVTVKCHVPRSTLSAHCEVFDETNQADQSGLDYISQEKQIVWVIKKFTGGSEMTLRVKVSLSNDIAQCKREFGPVSVSFELPMMVCSNLNIRYLKQNEYTKEAAPLRWVRSITQSSSYVTRIPV
jgi:AP-4 complex subunit mu-1